MNVLLCSVSSVIFSHSNSKWEICGEPAISLHSYTVSLVQWVNALLLVMWDPGSIPRGYLCETGILLLALSYYIGDPDVIDHCGLVWGGLRPKPSLGRRANYVIIPLDLTSLSCPSFTLAAGPPSGFTTDIVGCRGEPCGDPAIALHSSSLTNPVGQPFASRHEGPRFNPQGGT